MPYPQFDVPPGCRHLQFVMPIFTKVRADDGEPGYEFT
jgi:hypothetical protein